MNEWMNGGLILSIKGLHTFVCKTVICLPYFVKIQIRCSSPLAQYGSYGREGHFQHTGLFFVCVGCGYLLGRRHFWTLSVAWKWSLSPKYVKVKNWLNVFMFNGKCFHDRRGTVLNIMHLRYFLLKIQEIYFNYKVHFWARKLFCFSNGLEFPPEIDWFHYHCTYMLSQASKIGT